MTQRSENDFPTLTEEGQKQAERLLESFKEDIARAVQQVARGLYCDVTPHIETDAWMNYRIQIVEEMRGYGKGLSRTSHDAKIVRESIFREYRAELIEDLNRDHLDRIAELERYVETLQESLRGMRP